VRASDGVILNIGSTGQTLRRRHTGWGREVPKNRAMYEALRRDGLVELWAKPAEYLEKPDGSRWSLHAAEEDALIGRYRPICNEWNTSRHRKPAPQT
jgi:hypothetical protein